jgi:L-ribulokinase
VQDGILPGYFGYEVRRPPAGAATGAEPAAFVLRGMVERVRGCGVPVRRFVACGPPFSDDPRLTQIHADVLGEKIVVVKSAHPAARGAAVLGCLAAGEPVTGYAHPSQAIHAMAGGLEPTVHHVDLAARREYERAYALQRQASGATGQRHDDRAGEAGD